MSDHLSSLIGRMTPTCRGATARAANLCVTRGHHEVDVEHVLLAMLETPGCDLNLLLDRLGNLGAGVRADLEGRLKGFRDGNAHTPVFAGFIPSLFEQADVVANQERNGQPIRSGHVLAALLGRDEWRPMLARVSPRLASIDVHVVRSQLMLLATGVAESPPEDTNLPPADAPSIPVNATCGTRIALDRFSLDLTDRARNGQLDPVVGREAETLQLINILCRRRQNNPILVGEAGVGKTAVVEGLALSIARGQVPELLKNTEIRSLDMGLLQAGASVKGEFESRLRDLLSEVQSSPHPIILFIDEAHTLIGAGGTAGQNDAANLLKPALARGELRTIAATTWAEYKRYVEKDAALTRRFQPVKVSEPDHATAEDMLRAIVPTLEAHAGVRIVDEAVQAAVALSARYIADRQLPDKAIALLDTAVARVMLSRCEPHPSVTLEGARLFRAKARVEALLRDMKVVDVSHERAGDARLEVELAARRLEGMQEALAAERALVERIEVGREGTEPVAGDLGHASAIRDLEEMQADIPLVPWVVDASVVAAVVAEWTGVPAGRIASTEALALSQLESRLAERVTGQGHALAEVANRVRSARAGLADPRRPQGVFLFVGPSGVGKTETALALAEALSGSERKLITINMSEYQEAHSVSGLKGAPAGYVGYGEGGTLTEAVRRQPYSVLLLDEVEKAHGDVLELFYQVFDRGYMADAEGREVDFRQTTIILTSNVGSAAIMQACLNLDGDERPDRDALLNVLRPSLYKAFKPAFLGRTTVVPFYPLSDDVLEVVIRSRLDAVGARLIAKHGAGLSYGKAVVDWVLSRCKEADAGARDAIRIIDGEVVGSIASLIMVDDHLSKHKQPIKLSVAKDQKLVCKHARASAAGDAHV
ncbi:MAG TPA: type VI secretion system ATPase TssH [Luteibacter sp.]|uniref:type VI secretion system ATPase TssH n=1 Tax=Luteibacter sp. TaxID=1886636 RepID=UPI002C66F770|nr:type VI secretion system ATPase TssH [Luteibacter sp.]HVI55656.1 type VI secretion system ATPase TssH [Luteibacter sp.]